MIGHLLANVAEVGRDPEEIRDAARRVMLDPAFDRDPSLFERAMDRIYEFLAERFEGEVFADVLTSTTMAWIVAVAAVVLLSLAVWRWTRGLRVDAATLPDPVDTAGRTATDWSEDADAAEERGEFETSLRYRYLAIVASLEEAGWLAPLPGRTIRELDRELGERWPEWPEGIHQVGRRVEAVIFGGAKARPEDLQVARDVLNDLDHPVVGANR